MDSLEISQKAKDITKRQLGWTDWDNWDTVIKNNPKAEKYAEFVQLGLAAHDILKQPVQSSRAMIAADIGRFVREQAARYFASTQFGSPAETIVKTWDEKSDSDDGFVHPLEACMLKTIELAHPVLTARVAYLEKRLEVVPGMSEDSDGIACRNDTIKIQDERIERLTVMLRGTSTVSDSVSKTSERISASHEAIDYVAKLAEAMENEKFTIPGKDLNNPAIAEEIYKIHMRMKDPVENLLGRIGGLLFLKSDYVSCTEKRVSLKDGWPGAPVKMSDAEKSRVGEYKKDIEVLTQAQDLIKKLLSVSPIEEQRG